MTDEAPTNAEDICRMFEQLQKMTLQLGYWEVSAFVEKASELFTAMADLQKNNTISIKKSSRE